MKYSLVIYSFLFLTLIILVFQASQLAWFAHLSTDIYVYYNRASYFFDHLSLANLHFNEHLPGAILFFIAATPAFFINYSLESYTAVFVINNILLILALAYIYKKFAHIENIAIFSAILLFSGPIIFFRFDLLAVFLVVASFYFWKQKKYQLSAIVLGISTCVKIYPVIFLPYLIFILFKKKGLKKALLVLTCYIISLLFFLISYMLVFHASLTDILFSLNFHASKPVHTESIWATLLTLYIKITSGSYPEIISAWGINGLSPASWVLPLWFYNYIWILPLSIFYIWLFGKISKKSDLDIRIPLTAVLLFLIFSKVLSHQYLFWFILLIPLLDIRKLMQKRWSFNLLLILVTTLLRQYIYPLQYSRFLYELSSKGISSLFWINALGNFILIILFVSLILELKASYKS